ncbi:CvfD/Ygs/GSP13 family RNA-binding post-transcriptional regulator [Haloplasma contractile]|uniref:Polyribonucleotide nucleotidyltransferase protein n=1 Tax=Haloplasma contractile SSD-17B TaxID=1033810 RepID=U2FKQ5_9MOLU|nr:CvfD/Ygs/GSP13 family RNA-binding post-transcriptional regulator [Haloplasma contractile]ERJ13375.1 polyribonucleotide nucleotidyltransferase protein [Haloplasma contractile SSD-17B]
MALKEGSVVRGKVTGIQPYGVFVKLSNEMNGLIHISELTDDYVKDVSEYAKVGDIIRVKVLEIDDYNNAKLSLKQANNYYANLRQKKQRKRNCIKETHSGFKNLEKKLDDWVQKKIKKQKQKQYNKR